MRATPLALVLVTSLLAVPGAAAADPPPAGAARYEWQRFDCYTGPTGQSWGRVGVKLRVFSVPDNSKTYYQDVYIQVDGQSARGWKKIEGESQSRGRFMQKDLPTYSVVAMKAAINGGSTYSGKVKVKLRQVRTGPDPTKWDYTVRSPTFECGTDF